MQDIKTDHYQLLYGDCAVRLADIPDQSINLTVTSPPYDNLREYAGFVFDFDTIATELYRVTRDGGVVVWNVADATIDGSESGTSFRQALKFMDLGFKLHDTMIYEKGNFSNPSRTRYHQIFEYMFVFSRDRPSTFNPIKDKQVTTTGAFGKNTVRNPDGTMSDRERKDYAAWGMRTNIWRMKTAGQENPCQSIDHPAKMPRAMAHDHIISWSNPSDTVLDPFAGSGTTGIEALKTGRKFIGIELAPEYFEMTQNNLHAASPFTLFEIQS